MTATSLGFQPLTPEEEAEVLADVASDGPEDPAAAMVGRLLATVDSARSRAAAALQERLDEDCREYAEAVALVCPHVPRHRPDELFGVEGACSECDEDVELNIVYGGMYSVVHVAHALGVKIEMQFPDVESSDRVRDLRHEEDRAGGFDPKTAQEHGL